MRVTVYTTWAARKLLFKNAVARWWAKLSEPFRPFGKPEEPPAPPPKLPPQWHQCYDCHCSTHELDEAFARIFWRLAEAGLVQWEDYPDVQGDAQHRACEVVVWLSLHIAHGDLRHERARALAARAMLEGNYYHRFTRGV